MNTELLIRLAVFVGVIAAMAWWETQAPRRARSFGRVARWPSNLAIVALNSALVKAIVPAGAVGFAAFCASRGWGLMNLVRMPTGFGLLASVVVLDFVIYLQHVMFHALPALWRIHRMHHADLDFDVTTGARFHPLEILISMGIKMAAVAALGPTAAGVLAFEVILNATSMFNHANAAIPQPIDAILRLIVVTPDMHRVHHSIAVRETNSNFGFNLPWWDRMLGTYRAQPAAGHSGMTIGIAEFRDERELRLDRMLTQPWRGGAGDYPING